MKMITICGVLENPPHTFGGVAVVDDDRVLSQTQVLLTKIVKLCSEIRDIKKNNKLNNIVVNLSKINNADERTGTPPPQPDTGGDRKSTRLNSSHVLRSRMPSSA